MSTWYLFELIRWQPPAPGQDNASRSGANRDTSAYTAQSYSNPGGMEQYNQLPPLQRSIIKFIIDNRKDEQGVHVAAILRGLNTDRSKIEYVAIFSITIGLISPSSVVLSKSCSMKGIYSLRLMILISTFRVEYVLFECTYVCTASTAPSLKMRRLIQ